MSQITISGDKDCLFIRNMHFMLQLHISDDSYFYRGESCKNKSFTVTAFDEDGITPLVDGVLSYKYNRQITELKSKKYYDVIINYEKGVINRDYRIIDLGAVKKCARLNFKMYDNCMYFFDNDYIFLKVCTDKFTFMGYDISRISLVDSISYLLTLSIDKYCIDLKFTNKHVLSQIVKEHSYHMREINNDKSIELISDINVQGQNFTISGQIDENKLLLEFTTC